MLKTLFYSICIYLLATVPAGRIYASDYFSNALRIYSEGRFFEASIEFERAIFYENDSNRVWQYQYYKSLCYKGLADYTRALEELKNIKMRTMPDSILMLISYERAVCSFLNNDVNQATREIDEIKLRMRDTLKIIGLIPLNILTLNASGKWKDALILWNYYIKHIGLQDSARILLWEEVNQLYDKNNIPKFYSPLKAENLSTFLPGAGQMYCGAVAEGSFNFLINASLLGFSVWEFYTKYYFTGYFVGLRLFNKFYSGGIHRAGLMAKEKNLQGIKRFNAESSNLMMKVFETMPAGNPGSQELFRYP